jgi:hypothetical protein
MIVRTAYLVVVLTSSAAFAAPCATQVPVSVPRISVQRAASGSFRLHYENSYLAYAVQFGAPVVSIFSNSITITQPITEFPPPPQLPAPPPYLCDAEDVDLPALDPGSYSMTIVYPIIMAGVSTGQRYSGGAGFIVDANLDVPCTTTRTFSTSPSIPVIGAKVKLISTTMIAGFYSGTQVVRSGDSFIVTDYKSTEVNTKYVPYCLSSSVVIDPLPAGTYSVQWTINDFGIAQPDRNSSFSFRVAAGARHHAVR